MLKKIYLILFIFSSVSIQSQDPLFTQFFSNALQLNPALAGRDLSPRFHTTYRNQWPEINNAFVTYNIEYDQFSDKLHGGVGFQLLHDKSRNGSLNTTAFFNNVSVSSHFKSKMDYQFWLKASFVQKSLDWGNVI